MLYDDLDYAIAEALEVSVEEYIEKIEKTTYLRAEAIINGIWSKDPKIVKKVKRIFNLIR